MFKLKFKTANAAFVDDTARLESARILREIADRLAQGYERGACRDYNGNTVGNWELNL